MQGRSSSGLESQELRGFRLFLRSYVYVPEKHGFEPIPGMPYHLPQQIGRALEALRHIETAGNI